MRINAYLAKCNLGSRRSVEQFILDGKVKVNDNICTELSYNVQDQDQVYYKGKKVSLTTNNIYIMLNKPKGYICSVKDEKDRMTVLDLVNIKTDRIYPVGRLDYNTEGLLLLSNDGEFTNRVIHPRNSISKTYQVTLKVKPTLHQISKLSKGVMIDSGMTGKAILSNVTTIEDKFNINITIFEGKNRQVRKMFEAVGLKIFNLKRVSIGQLELDDLPLKKYKFLTQEQIELIFM